MTWQHIVYAAQLRYKQQIVQEQLERQAKIAAVEVQPVLPADPCWNYRNTAHLHVQDGNIGYYAAGTHTVIPLEHDPLLLPVMNDALATLRSLLPQTGKTGKTPKWSVQNVTLRSSATAGTVVAIVYGSGALADLAAAWQQATPTLAGCLLTEGRHKGETIGEVRLQEHLGGITFSLAPTSFFQVCTAQAETLIAEVTAALAPQPGQRILDAYCGVGTFALPLAKQGVEVMGIEEHSEAVEDGQISTCLNQLDTITWHKGTVERVLPTLAGHFDAVVLDPPRRGCHPLVIKALVEMAPSRIVYVSCQPGILARDVRGLLDGGYRLVSVQPVDMFPQTPHIESVVLLEQ
jgi:23S rRNA (uracil1939-C5)-methyltransferase